MIHMKCQALFSLKNKMIIIKNKMSSAAVVMGTLKVYVDKLSCNLLDKPFIHGEHNYAVIISDKLNLKER